MIGGIDLVKRCRERKSAMTEDSGDEVASFTSERLFPKLSSSRWWWTQGYGTSNRAKDRSAFFASSVVGISVCTESSSAADRRPMWSVASPAMHEHSRPNGEGGKS